MNNKIIVLGGIGNGTVIARAIEDAVSKGLTDHEFCGFLNDRQPAGSLIEDFPVLGNLADVGNFIKEDYKFINTIYKIEGQEERIRLFESLNIPELSLLSFIHPASYVASGVKIGAGTVIMPNVSVSSGVRIGKCCLLMTGVTVGHNDTIYDHCHLAAQACLGSYVELGRGVHIGLNATVREYLHLGDYSALGMGSVLLNNINKKEIWVGNPARLLRKSDV